MRRSARRLDAEALAAADKIQQAREVWLGSEQRKIAIDAMETQANERIRVTLEDAQSKSGAAEHSLAEAPSATGFEPRMSSSPPRRRDGRRRSSTRRRNGCSEGTSPRAGGAASADGGRRVAGPRVEAEQRGGNARLRKARDTVEEVAKAEARVRLEEEKLASVKAETERATALLEKHRDEHRVDAAKIAAEHAELDRRERRLGEEARSARVAPGKSRVRVARRRGGNRQGPRRARRTHEQGG